MILVGIIWGSTFFINKKCLLETNAIILTCYRFLISAVIIFIGLLFYKKNPFANLRQGIVFGLILLFSYLTQLYGLVYISASSSGFIVGLFIVFVPLLDFIFWRKKISLVTSLAVIVALIGLWILAGAEPNFGLGEFLTLTSSLFYALYVLLVDKTMKKNADLWVLNFQQFFTIGVGAVIIAFLMHLPFNKLSLETFSFIVYLAIVASVFAFAVQLMAQKHLSPVKISLLLLLEPVFAAIFAWTIGGEVFNMQKAIGGLFIVSAILFSELPIFKR